MAETNQPTAGNASEEFTGGKYVLADFRNASFDPGVKGVEAITHEGADVPKTKEKDVLKAANEQGVAIRKVEEKSS